MSVEDQSGYRHIPSEYDAVRWQHRLFVEIRKSPKYRDVLKTVRAAWENDGCPGQRTDDPTSPAYWGLVPLDQRTDYFRTLQEGAASLGLTWQGRASHWAVMFLHDDVLDRFREHAPPPMVTVAHTRAIEISISPGTATVDTFLDLASPHDAIRTETVRYRAHMMVGDLEWQELEERAQEAARLAVADLRAAFESDQIGRGLDRIALGREQAKETQIVRLAYRLTGRAGTRNNAKMDARWCETLRIDTPYRH